MKRAKYFAAAVLLSVASLVTSHINSSKVSATVPYTNSMVDTDSSGNIANADDGAGQVSVSKNGRYVAFSSEATNLVSGDTNGVVDTFVKDTTTGTVYRTNVSNTGVQSTAGSTDSRISANGRYVVFFAAAADKDTSSDTNSYSDVYERDLQSGTTALVSVNTTGGAANGNSSSDFGVSADGRYVVFESEATNLVSSDTNGFQDIFVRDMQTGTTTLISKDNSGTQADRSSYYPSISCDGAAIAFMSPATNLVAANSGHQDIYLVQRVGGDSIVDITPAANGNSFSHAEVSCDGSTIAFASQASNLVSGDTNAKQDLFTYDVNTGSTQRVDVDNSGNQANDSVAGAATAYGVSGDGRLVAFTSWASNLVSGDTNAQEDIFLRNTQDGTTERVSMRNAATQTNQMSLLAAISGDGEHVAFTSLDAGLVSGDTNAVTDVFLAGTGSSLCEE